jgi:hypothetical protein
MDNLTALKKIYVALGGDADDVADMTLLSEVISAIAGKIAENAENTEG